MKKVTLYTVVVMLAVAAYAYAAEASKDPTPPAPQVISGAQAFDSLILLDQETAKLMGDRQEHMKVQQALKTLQTYIQQKETPVVKAAEKPAEVKK